MCGPFRRHVCLKVVGTLCDLVGVVGHVWIEAHQNIKHPVGGGGATLVSMCILFHMVSEDSGWTPQPPGLASLSAI